MRTTARTIICACAAALALAACGGSSSNTKRGGHGPPPRPHAPRPPVAPLAPGPASATLTVHTGRLGRTIPPSFVGLSFEYWDLPRYAGTNPSAIDPVFTELIRNLSPGYPPSVRIGGVSTDHVWVPSAGGSSPPWTQFTLTKGWTTLAHAFAQATGAKLILGVNFEAASPTLAAAQAQALVGGIGAGSIAGLELGNEPELYSGLPWYKTAADIHIRGRSKAVWSPASFATQYASIASGMHGAPIAGPATGSFPWIAQLGPILQANPELKLATIHAYPLKRCSATAHVTIPELLSPASSVGLANKLTAAAATANAAHVPIRVAEFNSVSCGGEAGVSNTFAAALWSIDALFALANVGFDGVNFHSTPVVTNHLFNVHDVGGRWSGQVYPIYYGLQMFSRAAPPGSRIVPVTGVKGSALRAWATHGADGSTRVVLINLASSGSKTITVRIPHGGLLATLQRLTDPGGLTETSGVTLDGQSFGAQTTTGILAGTPSATEVPRTGRGYRVTVPAASAALLTAGSGNAP
jgi:Glycosyl hydrolase family 79 C-terminal beta domain